MRILCPRGLVRLAFRSPSERTDKRTLERDDDPDYASRAGEISNAFRHQTRDFGSLSSERISAASLLDLFWFVSFRKVNSRTRVC